jgi:pimeloyl-ACP methyl ester carboxylesterase
VDSQTLNAVHLTMQFIFRAIAVLVISTAGWITPNYAIGQDILGFWNGKVDLGSSKLRITFILEGDLEHLTATMGSPDQGDALFPCSEAYFSSGEITLRVKEIGLEYHGALVANKKQFEGQLYQGGQSFPCTLVRERLLAEAAKPKAQEPLPPFPYNTFEISFAGGSPGVMLSGTLSLPNGKGPFPCVILITGSGPQNRDEEILGHKPFLVLSDYLVKKGMAVFRYDDRGIAQSGGNFMESTTLDFANDARAALQMLQENKQIDKSKIGLAGHSEGGTITGMVAADNPDVAFVISIAGTGLPGGEVLIKQNFDYARSEGASVAEAEAQAEQTRKMVAIMTSGLDSNDRLIKLKELYAESLEPQRASIPNFEKTVEETALEVNTPWLHYFLNYNPQPDWMRVKCPVLALNGGKDVQVNAQANLSAISSALEAGKNYRYKTTLLPDLNHLFQTAVSGSPSEYGQLEETFSTDALESIADWLAREAIITRQ